MYFSRVQLDPQQLGAKQLGRLVKGDQYFPHQILWQLFSSGQGEDRDKKRSFIYRGMDDGTKPTFYVLSEEEPQDNNGYFHISSKPFSPKLQAGMRLRFDLRANPVKRSRTEDGKQQRHDVVMDKKRQQQDAEPNMRALEHDAGRTWLEQRGPALGFTLSNEYFAADSYRQHRIPRRGGKKPIRFSSLDLRGVLEIEDVDRFRKALLQGIGPAKSFGCGLLLIRPA